MPLTTRAKARLVSALTRKVLADEFEAALDTPAPLSAKLKAAIIAAMAKKAPALELIAAMESVGPEALSLDAKRRLTNAFTRKVAEAQVEALLAVDHTPVVP